MKDYSTSSLISRLSDVLRDDSVWSRLERFSFPAILLVALIARLWTITDEDAWFDEIATMAYLNEATLSAFLTEVKLNNPPVQQLYPVLEYYWARWLGNSDISLRLFSILPAMLTLYWVKLIGERLVSRRAGLIAAFLLATSNIHVYYSQEIRMYPFTLMFSVLSIYSLIRLLDTNEKRWWSINILATVFIAWTHMLGVFFLVCEFIFVLFYFQKENARLTALWCFLQALAIASLLPWFLSADFDSIRQEYVFREMPSIFYNEWGVHNLSIQGLYREWIMVWPAVGSGSIAQFCLRLANWSLLLAYLGAYMTIVYRLIVIPNTNPDGTPLSERNALLFIVLSSVVPVFALFLLSAYWEPSFFSRYVLVSLVGMTLVLATALDKVPKQSLRRLLIGLVVVVSLLQLGNYLQTPARRPWSAVEQSLSAQPESYLRVHLYGGTAHIMRTEARFHIEEQADDIRPHEDLESFHNYMESEYGKEDPNNHNRADILIVFTTEAVSHLERYFQARNIDYRYRMIRTRMPLYYMEVGSK